MWTWLQLRSNFSIFCTWSDKYDECAMSRIKQNFGQMLKRRIHYSRTISVCFNQLHCFTFVSNRRKQNKMPQRFLFLVVYWMDQVYSIDWQLTNKHVNQSFIFWVSYINRKVAYSAIFWKYGGSAVCWLDVKCVLKRNIHHSISTKLHTQKRKHTETDNWRTARELLLKL